MINDKTTYKRTTVFFLFFALCFSLSLPTSEAGPEQEKITLFHLNDTYRIAPVSAKQKNSPEETVPSNLGGMSRVKSYINSYREDNPGVPVLLLHAGDILSPSLLSWKEGLRGKQMINILNRLPLDVAVFGNHEFDFGCRILEKRVQESNFIWLSSNLQFPKASLAFKKIRRFHIIEYEEVTIGIFGLTVNFRPAISCRQYGNAKIIFNDPVKAAKQVVTDLKTEDVDIIIGVTHLNMSTDKIIAQENPEIDLIIGGHEHISLNALVGNTLIRKAGSDSKELGKVELIYSTSSDNGNLKVEKVTDLITINNEIEPDADLKKIVDSYQARIEKYREVIGETEIPLEARSGCMRTHETNIGSLIADLMRVSGEGDLAIINGGAFRTDKIIDAGPLTLEDVYTLLPFDDKIVTIEIDGKALLEALENGVAKWGSMRGGFPQVSGIKFEFNPQAPDYNKVIKESVEIGGNPLQLDETYKLTLNNFLATKGKIDGYIMFKDKEVIGEYGLVTDVLIEFIRGKKTISPTTGKRILISGTDPLEHYNCGDTDKVF